MASDQRSTDFNSTAPTDSTAALSLPPASQNEFRVADRNVIGAILKQLLDAQVRVSLNGSSGNVVGATLWGIDPGHDQISLHVDPLDPQLAALLELDEAVLVGYMESIKLQFELRELVLVHGAEFSVLRCRLPRELFRFQRRSSFRVRPLSRGTPLARLLSFPHPAPDSNATPDDTPDHTPDATPTTAELVLRVLDMSIGGCALFLPDDVPVPPAGSVLEWVEITLDSETQFHVDLRLQHVTALSPDARGVRLGCEFVDAEPTTLRALQRFIDHTQKRLRLLNQP